MSTRSYIGVKEGNGVSFIYCHNDGARVGKYLIKYFNDFDLAKKLVNLGSISMIDSRKEVAKQQAKYVDSDVVEINGCYVVVYAGSRADGTYYERVKSYTSKEEMKREWDIEYRYLFDDGVWFVASRETDWDFVPVGGVNVEFKIVQEASRYM